MYHYWNLLKVLRTGKCVHARVDLKTFRAESSLLKWEGRPLLQLPLTMMMTMMMVMMAMMMTREREIAACIVHKLHHHTLSVIDIAPNCWGHQFHIFFLLCSKKHPTSHVMYAYQHQNQQLRPVLKQISTKTPCERLSASKILLCRYDWFNIKSLKLFNVNSFQCIGKILTDSY